MWVLPKRLRCESGSKLASVVYKFRSTHTPLFVYDEKDNFLGLLTAKKVLLKRKYNPSTLVESAVIGAPYLKKDTDANIKIIDFQTREGIKAYSILKKPENIKQLIFSLIRLFFYPRLKIKYEWIPLSSSYQSGENGVGSPQKDEDDLEPSSEVGRELDTNNPDNRT